jgi:transposase
MVLGVSRAGRDEFWELVVGRGVSICGAAGAVGVSGSTGYRWFKQSGGVRPSISISSGWRLSLVERDEISAAVAAGDTVRAIAARLGRRPRETAQ